MKLQTRKNKIVTIAIIAVVAVSLVVGVVFGVVALLDNNTVTEKPRITGIQVSTYPQMQFYVGDEFNYSGLRIQVTATSDDLTYFVDSKNSDLKCTGFDSSVPNNNVTITVTYKEYSTTYTVRVIEKPTQSDTITLESIRLSKNFQKTYSADEWNQKGPNFVGVSIILTFSDGSLDEVSALLEYCKNYRRDFTGADTYDLVVTYPYNGYEVSCTVPITITD